MLNIRGNFYKVKKFDPEFLILNKIKEIYGVDSIEVIYDKDEKVILVKEYRITDIDKEEIQVYFYEQLRRNLILMSILGITPSLSKLKYYFDKKGCKIIFNDKVKNDFKDIPENLRFLFEDEDFTRITNEFKDGKKIKEIYDTINEIDKNKVYILNTLRNNLKFYFSL